MHHVLLHRVHVIINKAYKEATRKGLLTTNPALTTLVPRSKKRKAVPFFDREIRQLLPLLKRTEYFQLEPAVMIALHTGMRLNEIFGLQWHDIHYLHNGATIDIGKAIVRLYGQDRKRYLVYGSPKSEAGRRKISVGSDLIDYLEQYRLEQKELLKRSGVKVTSKTPVISDELGNPVYGDKVSKALKKLLLRQGFRPSLTFHSFRHTHATHLLQNGVPINTVQERLGHSDPSVTLGTYGHVIEGHDERAGLFTQEVVRSVMRNSSTPHFKNAQLERVE